MKQKDKLSNNLTKLELKTKYQQEQISSNYTARISELFK